MSGILPLSPDLPESRVGRKAAALGKLIGAGFPVPPGVCIPVEAFQAALARSPAGKDLRLPDGLLEQLVDALPRDQPLAVRSSAIDEDLPDASLAGRYATFLNVTGPAAKVARSRANVARSRAIEAAILGCWQSYLSNRPAGEDSRMAVLIQPLIDAECAGVCFTVDPVRLQAGQLLVVSSWGMGAGVVGGSVPADTARLRRIDLDIQDESIADKHHAMRPAASGGLALVPVPDERRRIASLPESWLQRVGQFGLAIEQFFGAPQDIEWAIAGGQLWILQSRPVTALPAGLRSAVRFPVTWADETEPRHYWWLERINDRPGSLLLPAELDFVMARTAGGQEAVHIGGQAQTRWRKPVNGRIYMAAGENPDSPGVVRINAAARQDLFERLVQQDITQWEYWGPEITRANARLAAFDPRGADGPALAAHLEDACAAGVRHWMIHTLVPRQMRSSALQVAYGRLAGRSASEAAAEIPFLLAGGETIQTRLVESLYDLAVLALPDPEGARSAAHAYGTAEPSVPPGMEPFFQAYERLMSVYGGRICFQAMPGYAVDLPFPWREAPQHVWGMIAAYLPQANAGGSSHPKRAREEARKSVDDRVSQLCAAADPALAEDFGRILAYARRNAAFNDEHNHAIDQVSEGEFAQALLYAGRWLEKQSCLERVYDIFWLTTGEVLAALRGTPVDVKEIAKGRQAALAGWQALLAPACLGLPEAWLPDRSSDIMRAAPAPEPDLAGVGMPGNLLTGEPASRGRASGRARIADPAADLPEAGPGDVLVAHDASWLWAPVLPVLAALVLDGGSPGDHAAITAREFGLPVVCATHAATRRIPEGAWVTVDADEGRVTWQDATST